MSTENVSVRNAVERHAEGPPLEDIILPEIILEENIPSPTKAQRWMNSFKSDKISHIIKVKREGGCHIRARHITNIREKSSCRFCDAAIRSGDNSKALKIPLNWDEKTKSIINKINVKPRKIVTRKNKDNEIDAFRMNWNEIKKAERDYKKTQKKIMTTAKIAENNAKQIKKGMEMLLETAIEEKPKKKPKPSVQYAWPGKRASTGFGIKTRRIIR